MKTSSEPSCWRAWLAREESGSAIVEAAMVLLPLLTFFYATLVSTLIFINAFATMRAATNTLVNFYAIDEDVSDPGKNNNVQAANFVIAENASYKSIVAGEISQSKYFTFGNVRHNHMVNIACGQAALMGADCMGDNTGQFAPSKNRINPTVRTSEEFPYEELQIQLLSPVPGSPKVSTKIFFPSVDTSNRPAAQILESSREEYATAEPEAEAEVPVGEIG